MKAIGLLSGGLDSQLAVRLMLRQGIEIVAVHFRTIFCRCTPKGCGRSNASKVATQLGIPYVEFDNTKEFLEILKNPPHGYGSGMNPCIDCRILMFKKVKEYMDQIGAGFIVTGEVLGQRPMSQHRKAMELIERESGLAGLIVRPLSCKLLPRTIPEINGWIDRDKLLGHSGRTRKVQMELAEEFGMKDYPCPAGGCLLTDPQFSKRLKESFQHNEDTIDDIKLLMIGRHFRILDRMKLVVGRNEMENKQILNLSRNGDILIEPVEVPGPTSLLRGKTNNKIDDYLRLVLSICARYCDGDVDVVLRYAVKDGAEKVWKDVKVSKMVGALDDYCRRI